MLPGDCPISDGDDDETEDDLDDEDAPEKRNESSCFGYRDPESDETSLMLRRRGSMDLIGQQRCMDTIIDIQERCSEEKWRYAGIYQTIVCQIKYLYDHFIL